ncbi:hypothetical protein P691DRAFT_806181 [Macrolepiota fuliginosa MF-IS2]|uniref:Uncharacterized protein n=1 Tax=Macrolepiota fuliginosa MF-IS2 TaxID=1400762 RepID=A0A9P6C106_9AGAR|nr:hypothetical protein P691DRAFT_806181 [Macrolepiota fuliginosa MF-IS2]
MTFVPSPTSIVLVNHFMLTLRLSKLAIYYVLAIPAIVTPRALAAAMTSLTVLYFHFESSYVGRPVRL